MTVPAIMHGETVKPDDIHHRRLSLYLIGSGFLLLLAAEVWVKLA